MVIKQRPSVTLQLPSSLIQSQAGNSWRQKITIDMQLIDFLNRGTLSHELLINGDDNVLSVTVIERAKQIKMSFSCIII